MPKKYPALTVREVAQILKSLGFHLDHQTGSHQQWYRKTQKGKYVVTLPKHKGSIPAGILKSIIKIQSGVNREKFYGATKRTAKKIR